MLRIPPHCPVHLLTTITLAMLAFAGTARAGMAVGELDQSYTNVTDSNTIVAARFETAQTFTVGRTGTLEAIDSPPARPRLPVPCDSFRSAIPRHGEVILVGTKSAT